MAPNDVASNICEAQPLPEPDVPSRMDCTRPTSSALLELEIGFQLVSSRASSAAALPANGAAVVTLLNMNSAV